MNLKQKLLIWFSFGFGCWLVLATISLMGLVFYTAMAWSITTPFAVLFEWSTTTTKMTYWGAAISLWAGTNVWIVDRCILFADSDKVIAAQHPLLRGLTHSVEFGRPAMPIIDATTGLEMKWVQSGVDMSMVCYQKFAPIPPWAKKFTVRDIAATFVVDSKESPKAKTYTTKEGYNPKTGRYEFSREAEVSFSFRVVIIPELPHWAYYDEKDIKCQLEREADDFLRQTVEEMFASELQDDQETLKKHFSGLFGGELTLHPKELQFGVWTEGVVVSEIRLLTQTEREQAKLKGDLFVALVTQLMGAPTNYTKEEAKESAIFVLNGGAPEIIKITVDGNPQLGGALQAFLAARPQGQGGRGGGRRNRGAQGGGNAVI